VNSYELWCEDYRAGLSISQISRKYGAPLSTVRKALIALGVTMRERQAAMRLALAQGRGGRPPKS